MSVIVGEWYARIGEKRAHRLKDWPIRGWHRAACGALTLPTNDWEPARWQHWPCARCTKLAQPPATGEGIVRGSSS